MRYRVTLRIGFTFLAAVFVYACELRADWGTIALQPGGSLNGQTIDAQHYWIAVSPGDAIAGTIKVQTNNMMHAGAVAPLGYTATWGDRTAQPVTVNSWIAVGLQDYDIPVNKAAPTASGIYYLPTSFSGVYNIEQVFSGTHSLLSPVWYDGNDLGWDWSPAQYQQARTSGIVTQQHLAPSGWTSADYPANWVGVNVVPGKIAYTEVNQNAGTTKMCTMNAAGGGRFEVLPDWPYLINTNKGPGHYSWSPDGQTIAFTSGAALAHGSVVYTVGANGENLKALNGSDNAFLLRKGCSRQ